MDIFVTTKYPFYIPVMRTKNLLFLVDDSSRVSTIVESIEFLFSVTHSVFSHRGIVQWSTLLPCWPCYLMPHL